MPPASTPAPLRLATVGGFAAALLWPTLLNHHPYLFWDTYGYFLQGRDYWALMLARVGWGPVPPEAAAGWIGAAGRMLAADPAIRSITYSLLLWPTAVLGSFWLLAALTALAAAWIVDLALERLFGLPLARRLAVFGVLLALSPLPWFASFTMPDLWGGLMVLAMAMLAFARLQPALRIALAAFVALSTSFHAANPPLALALAVLAAALVPGGQRRAALARLALPILAAMLALAGLAWLAFGTFSLAPKSPPFLLARQVEDGPLIPYLRESCGHEDWALCAHLDTMWSDAQQFLWSERNSYWSWSDLRDRLRREEGPLVLRAALARPMLQLTASARNAALQLVRFGLMDLVVGRGALVAPEDYWFTYSPSVPAQVWGLRRFSMAIDAAAALSLVLVLCPAWLRRTPGATASMPRAGWFLLAALPLNAAICGVISGPNDRYQARIVWLLPLLATARLVQPGREAATTVKSRAREPAAAAP